MEVAFFPPPTASAAAPDCDGGLCSPPAASSLEVAAPSACVKETAAAAAPRAAFPLSPASVAAALNDDATPAIPEGPIDLDTLIEHITIQLAHSGGPEHERKALPLCARYKLRELLKSFDPSLGELARYVHVDASKKYTRNLIATNEDFTLMLLCWNAGRASPIHDHPGHGCWMRVVDGSVTETRYRCDGELNKMVQTSFAQANAGDVIYIDDNIAFHKVGNPSETELAFSLHLYSPPFNSCSIWLEDTPADKPLRPLTVFHSEFGEVVSYNMASALSQ